MLNHRKAIEILFQTNRHVFSLGYVGVKFILFIPWLVDKGLIHEPTQRVKGLLGDNSSSFCCVVQKVCVVLTVYLHILYFYILPYAKYQCWVYIAE